LNERSIELRATYRLQLTADFGFAAARALVPYLRDLGISHLYLSPSAKARHDSRHSYDVIDPRRVSDSLGGEAEFRGLAGDARGAGMGVVLDIVPNHMAADDANPYWADPSTRERFFDIDPVTGRHRRFFDVDELVGVRVEDVHVFEETHELVLSLVRDGLVDGLRIDYPDGLADPAEYLARLRERGARRVWVEKILGTDERLRPWPVAGTVGYDFLNDAGGLFIDPAGEAALTSLWTTVSGDPRTFEQVAAEAKLEQARGSFWTDVEWLGRELGASQPPGGLDGLARALASLPVYRTYVEPTSGSVALEDRAVIDSAGLDPGLARLLLLDDPAPPGFVTRFQQTTPGVMAKGVEDTAFYRYGRLLALNEVGGDPGRFGVGAERFHARNLERAARFPLGMLSTGTHDAKRSGDVRARIGALASMSREWAAVTERFLDRTESLRSGGAPDDIERYFLLQTLVGTWPIAPERIEAYMEKALREAKRNTSWVRVDPAWEAAVMRFCAGLWADRTWFAELAPFLGRVAGAGERAALGQVALKLTCPGIPDFYQGDELGYRALVDPDNRRPVDWRWRQSMLARLMGGSPPDSGTLKMWLTLRLLTLRARRPEPFLGSYEPVEAGAAACAFVRGGEVLVVVGVRPEVDGVLAGPGGRWYDVLAGGERSFDRRVAVADVLGEHGVGVFERVGP
jgi:(1->4)-alpha-D-glucan 1-alpha-D-glucosylmutase